MFQKVVLIDAKGHMLGRLASIVAKELLQGQKIVVVRAEELNISGSLFRNKLKYHQFLRKRMSSAPRDGPYHYRSPARIFWRVVRGMIPHKTERGQASLERLKVFEGIPHPFDKLKRQVVPMALRYLRLRPGRKYCRLGDLSSMVGWRHEGLIKKLEDKRKTKSSAFYTLKKQITKFRAQAKSSIVGKLKSYTSVLTQLGH